MTTFLIQSSGNGHHQNRIYQRPGTTLADEVLLHNYYYFPCWEVPKYQGKEFSKIRPGDRVIHYFTGSTKQSPSMISYVSEVTSVDYTPQEACEIAIATGSFSMDDVNTELSLPRILRLKRIHTLLSPISRKEIHKLVFLGILSQGMSNSGRIGFNLCEVSNQDLLYVLSR